MAPFELRVRLVTRASGAPAISSGSPGTTPPSASLRIPSAIRLTALAALADSFPARFLAHPGMPGADCEYGEDDGQAGDETPTRLTSGWWAVKPARKTAIPAAVSAAPVARTTQPLRSWASQPSTNTNMLPPLFLGAVVSCAVELAEDRTGLAGAEPGG
jgi:hypothetical protein